MEKISIRQIKFAEIAKVARFNFTEFDLILLFSCVLLCAKYRLNSRRIDRLSVARIISSDSLIYQIP